MKNNSEVRANNKSLHYLYHIYLFYFISEQKFTNDWFVTTFIFYFHVLFKTVLIILNCFSFI